jgi:hypothetical protein
MAPPRPLLATPCAMLASSRARTSGLVDTTDCVCCTSDSSTCACSTYHVGLLAAMVPMVLQHADRWMW